MSATKRSMNWTAVSFTPNGGTAATITGVSAITINAGSTLNKFAGDGDRYYTTVVNDMNDPTVTIQAADLASIRANPPGTVGTFTATLSDARNGTGSGSIAYTLVNAVVADSVISGAHRAFGQGTLTLSAFSTDGVTNPLSTTIAP